MNTPFKYLFGKVLLVKKNIFSELFISMSLGDRKAPHLQIRFNSNVDVCFKR